MLNCCVVANLASITALNGNWGLVGATSNHSDTLKSTDIARRCDRYQTKADIMIDGSGELYPILGDAAVRAWRARFLRD